MNTLDGQEAACSVCRPQRLAASSETQVNYDLNPRCMRCTCSDPATHWCKQQQASPGTGQQGSLTALQGVARGGVWMTGGQGWV
jgi:hypothetical protein